MTNAVVLLTPYGFRWDSLLWLGAFFFIGITTFFWVRLVLRKFFKKK